MAKRHKGGRRHEARRRTSRVQHEGGCVWCVVTGVRGQPRARTRGEGHRPRPSKARGRGGQGKALWSLANSSFRCNLSHKHALADGQKGTKAAAGARHGGVRHACKTRAGACGAWCVVTGVRGQPRARARGEGHRPRPSKARGRGGQGKAHWSPANSSFRCNLSHKHALADGRKGTKAAAGARHGGVRHACKTSAKRGQRGQRAWGHEGGWVVMQCSSSTGGSSRHTQGLQHVSKHQQMGRGGWFYEARQAFLF